MSKLNNDKALDIIAECLKKNPDEERDSDSSIVRAVNIYGPRGIALSLRDGSYSINMNLVTIMDTDAESDDTDGSWGHCNVVLFRYLNGFGVAVNEYSSDYTFSNDEYVLSVIETQDWRDFERFCLTDSLREKLRDGIAESILLLEG